MWYVGTKKSCEAYDKKVSEAIGFDGNRTANWANPRRHPEKSIFAIDAHNTILPDEGSKLRKVELLTEDWNEAIEL